MFFKKLFQVARMAQKEGFYIIHLELVTNLSIRLLLKNSFMQKYNQIQNLEL
jgi:hypothetical protein